MSENLKVRVATASVIIVSKDDPYRILVADSEKHPKPVIPGGKIDRVDVEENDSCLSDAGQRCIVREADEETGLNLEHPKLIGKAEDSTRDIRVVPYSKVKESVIDPILPDNTPYNTKITASYGCPDFIYTDTVNETDLSDTEELSGMRFIDIRTLKPGELSAGHDVVVLSYREMLNNSWDKMHQSRLNNFAQDRATFSRSTRANEFNV